MTGKRPPGRIAARNEACFYCMQGTNAHLALELSAQRLSSSLFEGQKLAWKRSRHWFCPPLHAFLTGFSFNAIQRSNSEVLMHGHMFRKSGTAYLHEVALNGQPVLPAVAAIEVSLLPKAAVCLLAFTQKAHFHLSSHVGQLQFVVLLLEYIAEAK